VIIKKDNTDDDRTMELELLFEIGKFDDCIRSLFLSKIDTLGIDKVIENVKMNLPDGFTSGRYSPTDIQKRLKLKGC